MPKLCWSLVLLGIDFIIHPTLDILYFVLLGIAIDFFTGVIKSKIKKIPITSDGYRRTLIKMIQYLTPIIGLACAAKAIPEYNNRLMMACGFTMMFVIYVEITSIFENLYDIDSTSSMSKYFFKPILSILKFGIRNNPLTKIDNNKNEET